MKIILLSTLIQNVPSVVLIKKLKKGTITKNKQNILEKSVEFKEQQYQCKNCNKKFGIKNKALFDEDKYFIKQISDKIPEIMKKGYNSLRKNKSILQNILKHRCISYYY